MFLIKTGTNNLGEPACAAFLKPFNQNISLWLLNIFTSPQIAGAPDLRPSVSWDQVPVISQEHVRTHSCGGPMPRFILTVMQVADASVLADHGLDTDASPSKVPFERATVERNC